MIPLKLNRLWLGFPNYLYWCVDSCFRSEFMESKKKKEEERFLGGMIKMGTLGWQLNVGFSILAAKRRHQN